MKRGYEGATDAVAKDWGKGADALAQHYASAPEGKCDWGQPVRTGEKPDWYLKLFH